MVVEKHQEIVDRSQSLFNFVPQEKNLTVKLARLGNCRKLSTFLGRRAAATSVMDQISPN